MSAPQNHAPRPRKGHVRRSTSGVTTWATLAAAAAARTIGRKADVHARPDHDRLAAAATMRARARRTPGT